MTSVWDQLGELARAERDAVSEERWDDLGELQQARQRAIESVSAPPPPEAAPVLRAALVQSQATERALGLGLARVGAQLAALRRGRRVISAYGVAARHWLETKA